MDNAFVFAFCRDEWDVHGSRLQLHRYMGTCKDSSCTLNIVQGSATGYKVVSVVDERALMSSIAIETYQSSFQSHRGVIYAVRAYAPAESL